MRCSGSLKGFRPDGEQKARRCQKRLSAPPWVNQRRNRRGMEIKQNEKDVKSIRQSTPNKKDLREVLRHAPLRRSDSLVD